MHSRMIGLNRLAVFAVPLLICVAAAEAQRPDKSERRGAAADPAPPARAETSRGTSPARKVIVFRLRHNTADTVVALLEKVLVSLVRSEDLVLAAEPISSSILVAGTEDAMDKVKAIIEVVDVPRQEQKRDPTAEIKVFTLENVRAREAAETLRSLYPDRGSSPFARQRGGGESRVAIATDERANSVIVTGDKEILDTIEALLLRLDQSRPSEEAPQTEVIGVESISPDDAAGILRRLGVSGVEVVGDSKTNLIILRGDKKSVEQATQLLGKLFEGRRPQADEVRLRVIWLVSPGLAGEDAADPPQNLERVLNVLKNKAGVGDLKMAAQFVLNASGRSDEPSQQHFRATGTSTVQGAPAEVRIEGQFEQSRAPHPRLQIQIDATRRGGEASGRRDDQLCQLHTTVSAPPGHPVVLGMTPIDSMNSVFVIELLPPDDPEAAVEPAATTPAAP